MNAFLLTALASPAQSGTGAALNHNQAAPSDFLFADLLGQQTDLLDPELLDMLQSLNLDATTKKELLTQLRALDLDTDQLQQVLPQLSALLADKNGAATINEKITAALEKNKSKDTSNTALTALDLNQATRFISSTLFIARESNAIRTQQAPAVITPVFTRSAIASSKTASSVLTANVNTKSVKNTSTKADSTPAFTVPFQRAQSDLNQVEFKHDFAQPNQTQQNNAKPSLATAFLATADSTNTAPSTTGTLPITELSPALQQLAATTPTALNPLNQNLGFAPSYQSAIATPLQNTAQWGADFSRAIVQMAQQPNQSSGLQSAEIRIDPPELGPLRIVLSVTDSVANAMIFAAHAQTRLTVEQALPQLQQQLAQAGLSLGEASVSEQNVFSQAEQNTEQQAKNQSTFTLNGTEQNDENDPLLTPDGQTPRVDPNAIIDTFA